MELEFLDRFSKSIQIPNFTKIRPVAAQLFHADGLTDVMKLTVAYRNFANAPNSAAWLSPWTVTVSLNSLLCGRAVFCVREELKVYKAWLRTLCGRHNGIPTGFVSRYFGRSRSVLFHHCLIAVNSALIMINGWRLGILKHNSDHSDVEWGRGGGRGGGWH